MPKRINFSNHVNNVFSNMGTTYDEVKNLMFDLYRGELSDGVTKREAEETLRDMTKQVFGLDADSSKRDIKRALRDHAREYFDIIEEVVDFTVTTGLRDNEWFNVLVNYRNLADGDDNLFVTEPNETILSVARMGKRHHDSILQRLPGNKTYQIETDLYGAAIGASIDRYVLGLEDWTKLINAITRAFVVMIQDLIFTEVMNAAAKLPVQTGFVETGSLDIANRKKFNKVLQNVSVANDNSPVLIFGTMVGLQELENLIEVKWVAASQKEDVAAMGRLGNYGRYQLVEIPQRFARNDVTKDVYDDNKLFFFASGENKLVDFVDVGETMITEVTERGIAQGRMDDVQSYEVQREFGVGTRLGRYFGQWTITDD